MARDTFNRKTLKEDAFRDSLFVLIDWVHKRQKWFITGGVAVLVVAASVFGYVYHRRTVERDQAMQFFQAERLAGETGLKESERSEKLRAGYEEFLKAFPQGTLAPVAWLHLARMDWKENRPEEAIKAFHAVLDHGKSTIAQLDIARLGIARLEEARGNLDEAERYFKALSDKPYEELKAYNLGRIAVAREQREEARRQFEKVAGGQPGSTLAEWARQNLDYLP